MWFDESREIKLIELGNNGFNKSVRIRLENITRLKQMLMLDENNYCYIIHFERRINND